MMSEMRLPMRNPVRRAPFSQDLDRRAASKRAQKRGGCAQPYARDTVFPGFRSWRRLRKGNITKIISDIRLLRAGGFRGERGGTRAGYKGEKGGGGGIRPTTNDQSRGVMRNPVRDPMRGVDLMVLGYVVGASTPSQVAPGKRCQFASRTREPAY